MPHVPYKNHYSRAQSQEQALLSIWSLTQSKWLNNSDKIRNQVKNFGSIIFVVGKSPMDLMEPFLCRKKVP